MLLLRMLFVLLLFYNLGLQLLRLLLRPSQEALEELLEDPAPLLFRALGLRLWPLQSRRERSMRLRLLKELLKDFAVLFSPRVRAGVIHSNSSRLVAA